MCVCVCVCWSSWSKRSRAYTIINCFSTNTRCVAFPTSSSFFLLFLPQVLSEWHDATACSTAAHGGHGHGYGRSKHKHKHKHGSDTGGHDNNDDDSEHSNDEGEGEDNDDGNGRSSAPGPLDDSDGEGGGIPMAVVARSSHRYDRRKSVKRGVSRRKKRNAPPAILGPAVPAGGASDGGCKCCSCRAVEHDRKRPGFCVCRHPLRHHCEPLPAILDLRLPTQRVERTVRVGCLVQLYGHTFLGVSMSSYI